MIPYGRHAIDESDIAAVLKVLESDWLTTGPVVESFEKTIEMCVGAPSVSVSSGTAALHCAFAAIGIQPGDEVITPPLTFIATQATAAQLGAKIVFADVQQDTGNIDPELAQVAITAKTKAIVAVDYAGHPAELNELRNIADRHGIFLIEDAAHSIGSAYRGKKVGEIADITTFSFFPTKNITTGEGGAVSSLRPELLEKAKKFGRQGLERNPENFILKDEGLWHQEVHDFGLNYRLPDILCALGISQISKLPQFMERRRQIHAFYCEELQSYNSLRLPTERNYVQSNWHLFPLRVPAEKRKEIFNYLKQEEIGVQVNYLPAHLHPVFMAKGYARGMYPRAEKFYDEEISIPIHLKLTDSQVEYIVEKIKFALARV
jgi:UDP-4-amino-4,6-dideoxy-N-acetyl-beta-L-altrosamine transaminase